MIRNMRAWIRSLRHQRAGLRSLEHALLALLLLSGVAFHPSQVAAQDADMSFGEDGGGDDGADMSFGEEGGEGEGDGADMTFGGEGDAGAGGDDLIGDLAAEDEEEEVAEDRPTYTEAVEEIFAVQQIYALRINRVEVLPSAAFTLNDPFVSHPAISLGVNYWFTNVLAIGANFLWYEGLESESNLNFFVRRSTRLAVPISNYQLGAHLNFTYVPIYGKLAGFNEFIFQWDAYVVGGVGFMRTRPVPVIDPEVRSFDYDFRIAFNVGLGIRVFLSRWLALFGEIRNYMFLDQLENLQVPLGDARTDPEQWLQDSPAFTSNVTAHLGLTIFFPLEFEYQRPQ
jgi:outer membrane beta-barrel protein